MAYKENPPGRPRPLADVKWPFWLARSIWSMQEATALLLEHDPGEVPYIERQRTIYVPTRWGEEEYPDLFTDINETSYRKAHLSEYQANTAELVMSLGLTKPWSPIQWIEWALGTGCIEVPAPMRKHYEARNTELRDTEPLPPEAFELPAEVTKMKTLETAFLGYVALRFAGFNISGKHWAATLAELAGVSKVDPRYLAPSGKYAEAYDTLAEAVGGEPGRWAAALDALRQWADAGRGKA